VLPSSANVISLFNIFSYFYCKFYLLPSRSVRNSLSNRLWSSQRVVFLIALLYYISYIVFAFSELMGGIEHATWVIPIAKVANFGQHLGLIFPLFVCILFVANINEVTEHIKAFLNGVSNASLPKRMTSFTPLAQEIQQFAHTFNPFVTVFNIVIAIILFEFFLTGVLHPIYVTGYFLFLFIVTLLTMFAIDFKASTLSSLSSNILTAISSPESLAAIHHVCVYICICVCMCALYLYV